jgi:NADPH2:quinone reductase
MKAIVIHQYGGPEVLTYQDVPDPATGADDVTIRVHAVSIQRVLDVDVRAGNQQQRGITLPLVPGIDPSGVVVAVGKNVPNIKVGERVAIRHKVACGACAECKGGAPAACKKTKMLGIHRWGGDAEYCSVPYPSVFPIADSLPFPEATILCRHAPTAYNLLVHVAKLKAGETVLVMGASGNLGSLGLQIAKSMIGATVIAAAGSAGRVEAAMRLGADHGVNYGQDDLTEAVMDLTKGRGVDVLYDNIANPATCGKAIDCLAKGGRMVTAGSHGGPIVPVNFFTVYDRGLTIRGATGARDEDYAPCLKAAGEGKIKAIYERIMPLSQAAEAHRLIEASPGTGKIILDPTLG